MIADAVRTAGHRTLCGPARRRRSSTAMLTSTLRPSFPEAAGAAAGRRGVVSGVRIHPLPSAAPIRTAQKAATDQPDPYDSRVTLHRAIGPESGLELGYHLAADQRAGDVLAPLPCHGCLEPPYRRLADRTTAIRRDRRGADHRCLPRAVSSIPKGWCCTPTMASLCAPARMLSTLQWLGVVPSFSRPHVSDDNPYSESLFRTLKHTPAYPRLPFARPLGRAALDQSLRRLVQRRTSAQRDPLRHPRRAPLRSR